MHVIIWGIEDFHGMCSVSGLAEVFYRQSIMSLITQANVIPQVEFKQVEGANNLVAATKRVSGKSSGIHRDTKCTTINELVILMSLLDSNICNFL